MLHERLMSDYRRRFSMKNIKKEITFKVAKRNASKTHLKPRKRISIFQLSPGNRLHRIVESGEANLKRSSSVWRKENL